MMGFDPSMLEQLLQSMQQGGMGSREPPKPEGISRKFRYRSVANPSGLAAIVTTTSPVMPLRFEMEKGWASNDFIGVETQGIMMHFQHLYINPSVLKAHLKALEAYAYRDPQEAAAVAREALRISDCCPEAYNVLALATANNYEEALDLYKKGTELGPKVLEPGRFEEAVCEHSLWGKSPYRAHYRALYGVANTLRKMGRYQESLEAYDQLMDLDPNWYQFSSYVNVFATYPLALLGAKGPEATLKWYKKYKNTADQFTYNSSSLCYTATYALAELEATAASGVGVGKGGMKVTADDGWAADGLDVANLVEETPWEAAQKGRVLMVLCLHFPDAVDMLLGDKAVPRGMEAATRGPASEAGAAAYVYTAGSMWRARPTSLERLRKYRNTLELRCLLTDLSDRMAVPPTDIRHYMTAPGGFHKNSLFRTSQHKMVRTLVDSLCGAADGKEFTKDQLKVLKWLLDAGCPVHNDHKDSPYDSPLHMACYQGYGPECVKLLLAAGADVFRPNFQQMSAYEMTANQANWREVRALFEAMPQHKSTSAELLPGLRQHPEMRAVAQQCSIPEALLVLLFQSSCLPCLDGIERCMRCSSGVPHSPHADFFRYAEIVIHDCGITKLSKFAMHEMEEMARQAGQRSPWGRLYKHIQKTVTAAAKASKAGASSTTSAPTAAAAAGAGASSPDIEQSSGSTKCSSITSAASDVDKLKRQQRGQRFCWCCNAAGAASVKLKVCTGCRNAHYCSVDCQNRDWPNHKVQCKKWKAEAAAK